MLLFHNALAGMNILSPRLALSHKLVITACGADKVLRILPPLTAGNLELEIFHSKMNHILDEID